MDFLSQNYEFLLFQILRKETKIDPKPRSVKKSNNLKNLKKRTSKNFVVYIDKSV